MKFKKITVIFIWLSSPLYAEDLRALQQQIESLKKQTQQLQIQLDSLQKKLVAQQTQDLHRKSEDSTKQKEFSHLDEKKKNSRMIRYHSSNLTVHTPEKHPESIGYYPTALVADRRVVTYVAGTPVVTSPYLGARPAFDGSDYIVNISSINRDIRLMQQRRQLYQAYQSIGYPIPERPIIAISGKTEPMGIINSSYNVRTDWNLGSSELDVAAALNQNVEAYISIAYDKSPPEVGPRINNSAFNLNMGFVNIGNLDKSPFYFTAGQLYVPFGRYSSSMISAPLTLDLARTKTRPFLLGYKSQGNTGPFAAGYIYRGDTTLGKSGVVGVNLGYSFVQNKLSGEWGGSYISSMNDATGMQNTAAKPGTFAGFGSPHHGNEAVRKTPAIDVYGNLAYERFNLSAEWVSAVRAFQASNLSFNALGAKPQALQTEIDMTFRTFNRPSSVGFSYQWTKEALALNLPQQRFMGVFNISLWKDTVESLEYRHDVDYGVHHYANGAAPQGLLNLNTQGSGRSSNTLLAQIGVYF